MRTISTFMTSLLATANIVVGLLFLLSAYSPYIPPTEHAVYACLGLAFPIFLVAVLCFIVIWLLFRPRWILLPLLFIAIGWQSTTTYYAIGGQQEPEGETIKLLTFNTQMKAFSLGIDRPDENAMLRYLKESDADILCLQEFIAPTERARKAVDKYLAEKYPYRHHAPLGAGNGLGCYSRYPILSAKRIDYKSRVMNGSWMYRILVRKDTLLLVNNHLETNGMDEQDKEIYNNMLEGEKKGVKTHSKHLLDKLVQASYVRAAQADAVAEAIRQQGARYTVACGDFNDSPISYAHRVIGKGLNDAFAEAGWGLGITYHQSRMYFRIDHILASPAIRVVQCEVDRSISVSDHYPVWCILEKPRQDDL